MPAYGDFLVSEPSYTFTNIIYIFACNSHNNITVFCKFLLLRSFLTNIGKRFFGEKSIMRIDLSIVNTRDPTFSIVFFLKATSPRYSGNVTKTFIFNAVRAKLFYQFFKFAHNYLTNVLLTLLYFFLRFSSIIISFGYTFFNTPHNPSFSNSDLSM